MSDQAAYLAILALQTALKTISVANGYFFDVAATAVKLDVDTAASAFIAPAGPRPLLLITLAGDEKWDYAKAMRVKVTMPVVIHWLGETVPQTDESRLQTFFRATADIEKVVAANLNLGGIALDMRVTNRTLDTQVDGVPIWATVHVDIDLQQRVYGAP